MKFINFYKYIDDIGIILTSLLIVYILFKFYLKNKINSTLDYILHHEFIIKLTKGKIAQTAKLIESISFYLLLWFVLLIFANIWSYCSNQSYLIFKSSAFIFFLMIFKIFSFFSKNKIVLFTGLILIIISFISSIDHNKFIENFLNKIEINFVFSIINLKEISSIIIKLLVSYSIYTIFNQLIRQTITKTNIAQNKKNLYTKLITYLTTIFIFLFALNTIGIKASDIAVVTGALGVGIGFGLQKITSNFISGLMIIAEKKIKIGDLIYIPSLNEKGHVMEIDIRATIIENFSGQKLIIPNETITNDMLVNLTLGNRKGRLYIDFIIMGHKQNLSKVIRITKEIAELNPFVSTIDKPGVAIKEINNDGFKLALYFWVNNIDNPDKSIYSVKTDLIISMQERFQAEEIEFAMHKSYYINIDE